jgi:hypothetical protein
LKIDEPSKATLPELSVPSSKKFVPATIHKPHQDGTIVAVSADGTKRLRWNVGLKKYQLQEKSFSQHWNSIGFHTKASAYELAKDAHWDWRQPSAKPQPTAPPTPTPMASAVTKLLPSPSAPDAPGSIAAVMNAHKPDPAKMKKIGNAATGVSASPIYIDDKGQRWLVRRKKNASDDPLLELDVAANKLQAAIGLKGPKTFIMDVDGQPGAVQAMFDAKEAFPNGSFKPSQLSAQDVRDMQKEQVLDWLLGNNDAHSGQFIRLPNGHISSIDKGHAFRFYAKDKLDPDYKPWSPLSPNKHTYPDMWKAYANGDNIQMHDPVNDPEISQVIFDATELSDDEIRDIFGLYAQGAAKNGWLGAYGNDPEMFLKAIMQRRDTLHKDFGDLYKKTTEQRQAKLGVKTPTIPSSNDKHVELGINVIDANKKAAPGEILITGYDKEGNTIHVRRGKGIPFIAVVDGNGHTINTFPDADEFNQWWIDDNGGNDIAWDASTLGSKTTPTGVVENTWWEPEDELTTDDMSDVALFGKPGTTIGVTTDGSLALTYNVNTNQLETYKRAQSSDKWVLASKFHLPSDPKFDGEWEDDFADQTAYHSNEGVKSWLKGDVAAPHYGVPTNIAEHNAALGETPTDVVPGGDAYGPSLWNQKLTPEYTGTLVQNQVVATVTTDLGDFRVIAGGTSLPTSDWSKFRIQKKSTQGVGDYYWMTLETNVTLNDLPFAVQDHAGTSKWNIVDFTPPKPAFNSGADITGMSPKQVGVLKTYFNANGAKWHNKPEAIWDALQSFKSSDAGVGYEHLTNMQILAALDAGLPPSVPTNSYYTNKLKKWLKTKKGLDYVIAHPDVKKPTVLPPSSDEHPGTSLFMKALARPDMKLNTVIAEKDLEDGKLLTITKGQFDNNMIVYRNGKAITTLEPNEVDHYLKTNDDNGGPWKIYPTPDGPPVYATMSGKKPPLTPDVSGDPQPVKSFAEMDKWPWIPGDVVTTHQEGKLRVVYTDEGKFSLENNAGTLDTPKWEPIGSVFTPQSSLLGLFPNDTEGMTTTWYAGTPGGSDETLTPGLGGGPATSDEIWNATPSFGPATLAKTIATGKYSKEGGTYTYKIKIKQDGDGEGFKKLKVYFYNDEGGDTPTSYEFTSEDQLANFMNNNILGKNTVWTLAPVSTEGEVHDVSFAPSTTPVVDKFTGLSTTPNASLNDGTPASTGFTIPSDGWESIGDVNAGDWHKLHAVTPGKDYILVSNNGGYQIRKYDPKHNKYTYFAEGPNAKKLALDHADNWTYAVDLSPATKPSPIADQNLINLPDGTTVDKGPVVKVWKDLANKKYGNTVLAYSSDGQHRIKASYGTFVREKWNPATNKWQNQDAETYKLASLAKGVDNVTWHDATVVPPAAAAAPKPVKPVGVNGSIALKDGTFAPKGEFITSWLNLSKKSQYPDSTVIAYSSLGDKRLTFNKITSEFELQEYDGNTWTTTDTNKTKLGKLALKTGPNGTYPIWNENKEITSRTFTPTTPTTFTSSPPPPPDPIGVHGTVTLPNGTKAPLGPYVSAWGPHAKKSQYTKSTVIARSKSGTYRIIYNKPASQFELQSWDDTDKKWKVEDTESYKLASLAKNSSIFNWYENKTKAATPSASPSPLAAKTPSATTVVTPGGGLIDLGGGDISHLTDAKKQEIYKQFKAQPATYLSSPAQDIWAALLDISDNNGLTKMQTLRVIDDVGAKKVSKNDEHLFEKKIKDWLQTPAGYAILHNLPIPKPDTPKFAPGVEGKIPTFEESNKYSYSVLPVSETTKWFDKALKSHGVKPSGTALSGVTSYTGGIYHSINAYLYGGVQSISSSNNSAMVNAQQAMIPSVEPVLLHRGVGYNAFKAKSFTDLQKMVGQTRWMGGFGSTSTGGHSAFSGQVTVEIEAPPGTPMYWAKPISLHKSENEMLLAAGLYYRIISVTSKSGGATVRVRVVPKPEDESQIIAAGEMRW